MNGFCEVTQEEVMEIDGGAWKAIAKDIGLSILIDGAKKFAKEAWNNRANWGYSRMIPAAVLLCGEFMSVDSAEMDMVGDSPPAISYL